MNNNDAIVLLQDAADRGDAMLEMAQLAPTDARAIARLLKEQEPVEPFEEGINDFNCGKCGAGLSVDNDWKYCPHCGKKVKWE